MSLPQAEIGIIGGSGLYEMAGFGDVQEVRVDTPFGEPSDLLMVGTLEGRRVAFLPRHGRGHRLSPSQVPFRANVFAMKKLGVQRLISVSAVGSLREEIRPLDIVIPDQLIDQTRTRPATFFADHLAVHVGLAEPFCADLRALLTAAAQAEGATVHPGGTYLAIEGPQFSTRAESAVYRAWGASVIGMTAAPEAKLAREAELCYATLACSTDYDCWHPAHATVTAEMIITNLSRNVGRAKAILRRAIARMSRQSSCSCDSALKDAVVTGAQHIPAKTRQELAVLIAKYAPVSGER